MNAIVLGSGGREHALAEKLAASEHCQEVIVIPGNSGMEKDEKVSILSPNGDLTQFLKGFISERKIALLVIGPEVFQAQGLVDSLSDLDINIVGFQKDLAKLESSKVFSKYFMEKNAIKTARFVEVNSLSEATKVLNNMDPLTKLVVKCDELCAGKGVVVCDGIEEVKKACYQFFEDTNISVKTEKILLEERLYGREVSAIYFVRDGSYIHLGNARDYKRLLDGDLGPNTGGMGCISTPDLLSDEQQLEVDQIIEKTLNGMNDISNNYSGFIFLGLMLVSNDIYLLEYNMRLGDPETQTILPNIDVDLFTLLSLSAKKLPGFKLSRHYKNSIHVVKASKGYGNLKSSSISLGFPIECEKLEQLADDSYVYFSGVRKDAHALITNGGRVLGITSLGDDVQVVRENVYRKINNFKFDGNVYRTDIGLQC